MHNQPHSLAVRVGVERREVEVGIGRDEIEHEIFLGAEPVFPTFVPSLDQQRVETVLGGEVDVAAHVRIVGTVPAMRLGVGIVRDAELDRRIVGRIGPVCLAGDHFPPDAHVFRGMDPADIIERARVVEVEDQARSQNSGRTGADLDGAPGTYARGLQTSFHPFRIRRQMDLETAVVVHQDQVGGRIVEYPGFVDVDVESLVGFHLQGRLYGPGGDVGLRSVVGTRGCVYAGNLRQTGPGIIVFLGVVVSADPPGSMVTGQCEFRLFLGYLEVGQFVINRELVPEAQTVVVEAETDVHGFAGLLLETDQQFVVMIPDLRLFAPDRFPGFIECVECGAVQGESIVEAFTANQVEA